MASRIRIDVEMDDGRNLSALADQRDLARLEAQEISPAARHTWVRFLAWATLTRTKQYGGTWEQFNEIDCVQAADSLPEGPAGADEGLDPGRTAPGDGS